MSRYFPQKSSLSRAILLILLFGFNALINSCSTGIRVKNLINYPLSVMSMDALDTLAVLPDVVKYEGIRDSSFIIFKQDIRLQGRPAERPVWIGGAQGSFQVSDGAEVHILDFNFGGTSQDTALIRVDQGKLILENCDFDDLSNWAILVGQQGSLELRNVRFSDLQQGALLIEGGKIRIFDSQFDLAGQAAIMARGGVLFEAHRTTLKNTMGTAVELQGVKEVWLDSVSIFNSFEDGIKLKDCDFTLIEHVVTHKNGRHGLDQERSIISGLIDFSAVGNLVHGMRLHDVDTLRILNSELVGNGESGADLSSIGRSRIAGLVVAHNASTGFQIVGGNDLIIHHSSFQANMQSSLSIDSLDHIDISQISVVNNDNGVHITNYDELNFNGNLLRSNTGTASAFEQGSHVNFSGNVLEDNHNALVIEATETLHLESNRFQANQTGNECQSLGQVISKSNVWQANQSASFYADIGYIKSDNDNWSGNTVHALEVLSTNDLILSGATLSQNVQAVLLTQTSAKIESCLFDSSTGFALKVMNGSAAINGTKFRYGDLGVVLGDGSQARITQSVFDNMQVALDAGPSSETLLAFSRLSNLQEGIRIANYGQAEILSNRFDQVKDFCVELTGPHIQSVHVRQNIMTNSGGILRSSSGSGTIELISNTFANNKQSMDVLTRTISRLDHNIFYKTIISNYDMLEDPGSFEWNCYFPDSIRLEDKSVPEVNLSVDPLFDEEYFLLPGSECINGGKNGLQIGALGIHKGKRPELKP